jgi:ribose transport system permease protein
VIGGASLMGGRGSVSGAIIGAIIMATIRFGLNVLGMSPFLQQIAVGAILIAAVFLDNLRLKHEARVSKARFHR